LKRTFLRVVSMCLAVIMLVGTANLSVFASGDTGSNAKTLQSAVFASPRSSGTNITDADIVLSNYDLDSFEVAILNCEAIDKGASHSVIEPTKDLVTVDGDTDPAKVTVTANSYDQDGDGIYDWQPVSIKIASKDEAKTEAIPLDATIAPSYEMTFDKLVSLQYSVYVTYEMYADIAEDYQAKLLATPAELVLGIADLMVASGVAIDSFAEFMPQLYELVIEGVPSPIPNAGAVAVRYNQKTKDAITYLHEDAKKHNFTSFSFSSYAQAYLSAVNKVEYLLENGKAFGDSFAPISLHFGNLAAKTDDDKYEFADTPANLQEIKTMYDDMYDNLIQSGLLEPGTELDIEEPIDMFNAAFALLSAAATEMNKVSGEYWDAVDQVALKDTLSEGELTALDTAVAAVLDEVSPRADVITTTLKVAEKEVVTGVASYTVNVYVEADVVAEGATGITNIKSNDGLPVTIVVGEGADKAGVVAEISAQNIIADAVNAWNATDKAFYDIDLNETYYEIQYDEIEGNSLDSDIERYVVKFVPRQYAVVADFPVPATVPYGYTISFPAHDDLTKSYVYTIGDTQYYQIIDTYRVVSDTTITRSEGKALTSESMASFVADSIMADIELSVAEKDILKTVGLLSKEISYSIPTTSDNLVRVNGTQVTAEKGATTLIIDGEVSSAEWIPVAVEFEGDDTQYTFDNGVATIPAGADVSKLSVKYSLTITPDAAVAEEIAQLTKLSQDLIDQAETQVDLIKSAISLLVSGNNKMVDTALKLLPNLLTMIINDTEEGYNLSAETKAQAQKLKTSGTSGGTLKVVEYLSEYSAYATDAKKLAYYYSGNNGELIGDQIDLLVESFEVFLADAQFEFLINDLASAVFEDEEETPYEMMVGVKDDIKALTLPAVNSRINTKASFDTLEALAAKLLSYKNETFSGNRVFSGNIGYEASVSASPRTVIRVYVGNTLVGSSVIEFEGDTHFNDDILSNFNTVLTNLKNAATATIDEQFYSIEADRYPTTSDMVSAYPTYTVTYKVKNYRFDIMSNAQVVDQISFTYNPAGMTIQLPRPQNVDDIYYYTIGDGAPITVTSSGGSASMELSADAFKTLFASTESVQIVRKVETIDRTYETFIAFVDDMNAAFKAGNMDAEFIATENTLPGSGEVKYGLIMRVGPDMASANMGAMMQKLLDAMGYYESIALAGTPFFSNMSVKMQAIIDMLAYSGFSFDTICNIIDENGNIVDNTSLQELTPMKGSIDQVGGHIMTSTMTLVPHEGNDLNVALYITLSGSNDKLLAARNALATVKNYVNVACNDGVYNIHLNMPDKLYPYYMSAMLLLDQTQFENIQGGMNVEQTMKYYKNLVGDLTDDPNFTVETLEKTAAEAGKNIDLSSYAATFNLARKLINYLLNNATAEKVEGSDTTNKAPENERHERYLATISCPVSGLTEYIPESFADIADLISEIKNNGNIVFDINLTVEDRGTDYDAMIFDNSEAGLSKFYYAKASEFASRLEKLGNNSVVILISDAELKGDVVIKNNVFINLNGKKLTITDGTLSTTARVTISDSTLHTNEPDVGEVNGTLSGNFIITGGMYLNGEERMDVSAMLKDGYVQNADGYVSNIFYTIEEDADGNISINIPANILSTRTVPELKALAVDIAMDVAFNVYNMAAMGIDIDKLVDDPDGKYESIYSFATDDLISLATMSGKEIAQELINKVNVDNVKTLAQSIYYELTNFSEVATKINSDNGVIVDYELSTKGWGFQFSVSEENTIVVDLVPDKQDDRTFSIAVTGSEEDKALLAALFTEVGKSLKYDPTINHLSIAYNGGLDVDFDGELDVEIDLSHNNNYAALLVAAVASANNDANLKNILKTYLDETTKTEASTTALNTALENITLAQFVKGLQHLKAVGCDEMLASIDTTNTADLKKLEAIYDDLVYIAGVVLTRLDITGGEQKLAGHKVTDTFSTYNYGPKTITFDKRGVEVSMTLELTMTMMKEGAAEEELVPKIDVMLSADKSVYTVGDTITWHVLVSNIGECTAYLKNFSDTYGDVFGQLDDVAIHPGSTYPFYHSFTFTTKAKEAGEFANTVSVWYANKAGAVPSVSAMGTYFIKVNPAVVPGPSGGSSGTSSKPVVKDPKLNADASSDKLLGTSVASVGSDKYLQLDLHVDGITVEELLESLHISATGSRVEIEAAVTNSKTVDGKEIVVTGSVLTITAKNSRGTTTKEYVIVIDGDVNCDGYVNTADAVYLAWHYCDIESIEGTAAMIAATGNSKDTDVHADDAMRIVFKYLHWKAGDDRYVSKFGS